SREARPRDRRTPAIARRSARRGTASRRACAAGVPSCGARARRSRSRLGSRAPRRRATAQCPPRSRSAGPGSRGRARETARTRRAPRLSVARLHSGGDAEAADLALAGRRAERELADRAEVTKARRDVRLLACARGGRLGVRKVLRRAFRAHEARLPEGSGAHGPCSIHNKVLFVPYFRTEFNGTSPS